MQIVDPDRIGYDPADVSVAFGLTVNKNCTLLQDWLNTSSELSVFEQSLFDLLHKDALEDGGYLNEEELKIKVIGTLFRIADVEVKEKIKVFYERPLSATVRGRKVAVITDCLLATPLPFNKPTHPYFFLQEFKKKRGEKNDPEGQLMTAMLIAQEKNADGRPLYGGYLFGTVWNFATLVGNDYCVSREYNITRRDDLLQMVFIIRKLKELILNESV
ncbi:MAG: hypothetical protein EAZ91_22180 [Cytophagales bacterium]|nr:MAG: hypothetical protein EAZ91_22180 [Cytophagales bacterium]